MGRTEGYLTAEWGCVGGVGTPVGTGSFRYLYRIATATIRRP